MNTENIDKSLFEFAAFDELESEHIAAPRYSYWKSVFRTFFKNKFTVIVSILLIAVVAFALIQPTRSGYSPIDTPNINNAEMKFLKPSAELAFKGEGEFHCGEWCQFCKAKADCRERARANLALAAYDFAEPPLLTDEEVEEVLAKVDDLVSWANDIKEYALQAAISGKAWNGWKVV